MVRTIELGRAVFASPLHSLELWLTTFITISPAQQSIDIQQLPTGSLLDLLSSKSVWVGRGNGMQVELCLTLRGEPLPQAELQDLTARILEAPAWHHLGLQATLPLDPGINHDTVRICLAHKDDDDADENKTLHRVLSNVPPADLKPPEGIPKLELHAVRCSIDILEARQRPPLKRSRTAPNEGQAFESRNVVVRDDDRAPDAGPQDLASMGAIYKGNDACQSPKSRLTSRRKPKAQAMMKQAVIAGLDKQIEVMIDGAIRFSASGSLGKLSTILKIKANTFSHGLVDIAPNIWRPGHLQALSQRAVLLPTISRSISRLAEARSTTASLREKINKAAANSASEVPSSAPIISRLSSNAAEPCAVSVTDRLWLHLHKNLPGRSTSALPSFMAPSRGGPVSTEAGEILEPSSAITQGRSESILDSTLPGIHIAFGDKEVQCQIDIDEDCELLPMVIEHQQPGCGQEPGHRDIDIFLDAGLKVDSSVAGIQEHENNADIRPEHAVSCDPNHEMARAGALLGHNVVTWSDNACLHPLLGQEIDFLLF